MRRNRENATGPDLGAPGAEMTPEAAQEFEIRDDPDEALWLSYQLEGSAVEFYDLELEAVEVPRHITAEEHKRATLFGQIRDALSRTTSLLALLATFMGGAGIAITVHGAKRMRPMDDSSDSEYRYDNLNAYKEVEFGSPKFEQAVVKLRAALKRYGIDKPLPADASEAESLHYTRALLDIVSLMPEERRIVEDALLRHHKRSSSVRYDARLARKAAERMPDERWQDILNQLDYPRLLDKTAYEFGVEPYRRLGYQQYESFSRDVLEVARVINQRIVEANNKHKTNYPPISPGLIVSIALQEGLASQIDEDGYLPNRVVSTTSDMGMDSLVIDLPALKGAGLVPGDFDKQISPAPSGGGYPPLSWDSYILGRSAVTDFEGWTNEVGLNVKVGYLSQRAALEAIAALVVYKRNVVIKAVGIERWDEFNQEEQSFLTYAAYQWGQGNVVKLLADEVIPVTRKDIYNKPGVVEVVKNVPISNYTRYKDGKPVGQVADMHEYIYRNNGRRLRMERRNFHYTASQVAVSAKVADRFFDVWTKTSGHRGRQLARN